jgi:hypothetical protein
MTILIKKIEDPQKFEDFQTILRILKKVWTIPQEILKAPPKNFRVPQ